MKINFLIVPFILVLIFNACSNSNSTKSTPDKSFIDTNAYPKKDFYSVKLFVIDPMEKESNSSEYDTNFVLISQDGHTFINQEGIPKTKKYKSYILDSLQIIRLESFLTGQQCINNISDTACKCDPVFTSVFIFYDELKNPIAQFHIDSGLGMFAFYPYEDYMRNFDNRVNFQGLKKFVDSVKQTQ